MSEQTERKLHVTDFSIQLTDTMHFSVFKMQSKVGGEDVMIDATCRANIEDVMTSVIAINSYTKLRGPINMLLDALEESREEART